MCNLEFPFGVDLSAEVLKVNANQPNGMLKTEAIPLSMCIDALGVVGKKNYTDVNGGVRQADVWTKHFADHLFWVLADKTQGFHHWGTRAGNGQMLQCECECSYAARLS